MGRIQVTMLSLSAAALVGIAISEGYSDSAYVPVKGDVATIGFGDTQGVKPGDRTDPVRALIKLNQTAEAFQRELRGCIGDVPMHQYEWDATVSWAYNVGTSAACKSTLVKKLQAGDYPGACRELLRWDKFKGQPLPGLTKRRQSEFYTCMGH